MRRLAFASPALALLLPLLFLYCSKSSTSVLAPTASKCDLSASGSPASFGPAGGPGTVAIGTSRDCTWSIASSAAWLSLAAHDGQGPASVTFTVAANASHSGRSSTITVGAQQVSVNQAGMPCQYQLSRTADAVPAGGGPLAVGVTTADGCSWTAASDATWLTIGGAASGSGSGTVSMTAAPNPGGARVGHVNVGGQTYTVTQPSAADNGGGPGGGGPGDGGGGGGSAGATVQLVGTVSDLTGKCPNLTINLSGTVVVTNASTTFLNGHCPDVKNKETLTVVGTAQPDGSVVATQVDLRSGGNDH